ncbi:hypothetical protein ACHMW7_17760 [Aminobacter sp. UC22_36]|uniref:hypothetical protein n=1 Tax=Aminobacter sp. UC22_36 TaxID=3374549 RepID=UPI00375845C9
MTTCSISGKNSSKHRGGLIAGVVHGHTPTDVPRIDGRRLDIDTGAFKTGRLTAVRIAGKGGRLLFS